MIVDRRNWFELQFNQLLPRRMFHLLGWRWGAEDLTVANKAMLVLAVWVLSATSAAIAEDVTGGNKTAKVQGTLILRSANRPTEGAVLLLPSDPAREIRRVALAEFSNGFSIDATTSWQVQLEAAGYWGPRVPLVPGPEGTYRAELEVWALAKVEGVLRVADAGLKTPTALTVEVVKRPQPAPPRALESGKAPCTVDPVTKAFSCQLPATPLDLVFRAPGFVPHFRWAVTPGPGGRGDVGSLLLKQGASLAGFVVAEGGTFEAEKASASAELLLAAGGGARKEQAQPFLQTVPLSKAGFFQFEGLKPGRYRVTVRQEGLGEARSPALDIWPESESLLQQPLILRRPLSITVEVTPPVDWLGKRWNLTLIREGEGLGGANSESVHDGEIPRSGVLRLENQRAGRFSAYLKDSQGNRFANEIDREIETQGDAVFNLEPNLVEVEGNLTLGSEPLEGALWFGGKFGDQRVQLESNADGAFQGVLPREGKWRVSVEAGKVRVETRVVVEVGPSGVAKLSIELPKTRVWGHVVEENGRAFPDAAVSIRASDGTEQVLRTDEQGQFEAVGLPMGATVLSSRFKARDAEWFGDPVVANLEKERDAPEVEIRVRRSRSWGGNVASPYGAVPGAGVTVVGAYREGYFMARGRTDLEGTFSVEIPQGLDFAAVIISAPGFPLQTFPTRPTNERTQLALAQGGGNLQLTFSKQDFGNVETILRHDGIVIPFGVLVDWARGHGFFPDSETSTLNLPEVAPGQYQVCLVPNGPTLSAAPLYCKEGVLSPSGSLTLDLEPKRGAE